MPFGMGPAGWAYITPYAYSYHRPLFPVWPRWGGRGRIWGRGYGWRYAQRYWSRWWLTR
ncbi:MAG: hypothetical protein PHN78_02680 [Dehalococcoidales bacterium]|nr:hypothetical protein [Dehalococcoidales bacterium]